MPRAAFLIAAIAASGDATTLSDAAASLSEGQWAELKTTGWSNSLIATGTDNILNYSNSAAWDPLRKELRFVGQGHQEAEKMIIYSDSANAWRNASPPGSGGLGHGYDHNAVDPATGIGYYRKYGSNMVYSYDNGWKSDGAVSEDSRDLACCGSLSFFPELNALTFWGGGALYVGKNGKWEKRSGGLAMGDYHNVSEYSAPYRTVFGGGGNDDPHLYGLSAAGKVQEIPSAPTGLGIYSSVLVADPASGELIVIGRNKTLWSYYPGAGTWLRLPDPAVDLFDSGDNPINFMIAAGISTYRVIMVVKKDGVLLYRHKPQGPVGLLPDFKGPRLESRAGKPVLHLDGWAIPDWGREAGYRDVAGRRGDFRLGGKTPAGYLLPPTP